jgi:hypothetical protein
MWALMMMVASVDREELIDEAILRSSSSFALPPWTSSKKPEIWSLDVAPAQPSQMTREKEGGLIDGDAAPSLRRLPPLLPPEWSSAEEEDEDGPDLAKRIRPPTPILHKGRSREAAA